MGGAGSAGGAGGASRAGGASGACAPSLPEGGEQESFSSEEDCSPILVPPMAAPLTSLVGTNLELDLVCRTLSLGAIPDLDLVCVTLSVGATLDVLLILESSSFGTFRGLALVCKVSDETLSDLICVLPRDSSCQCFRSDMRPLTILPLDRVASRLRALLTGGDATCFG